MKVFYLVAAIIFMAVSVYAAPFLNSQNYPTTADQPDGFEVTITPLAPFVVTPTANSDQSVKLYYDLASAVSMGAGVHNASAIALKGGWRSGVSNTVNFTKPSLVAPVLAIVNQ